MNKEKWSWEYYSAVNKKKYYWYMLQYGLSQEHYANRKKLGVKDYIVHDFINIECPEKITL